MNSETCFQTGKCLSDKQLVNFTNENENWSKLVFSKTGFFPAKPTSASKFRLFPVRTNEERKSEMGS